MQAAQEVKIDGQCRRGAEGCRRIQPGCSSSTALRSNRHARKSRTKSGSARMAMPAHVNAAPITQAAKNTLRMTSLIGKLNRISLTSFTCTPVTTRLNVKNIRHSELHDNVKRIVMRFR